MIFKTLVVDDEPLIARSVSQIIPKVNPSFFVAKVCYNGKEALDYLKDNSVDIVFTDIQMPAMDGLTLANEIKQIDSSIPVIILTGYSEFEYAKKAISAGVVEYLLKPLNRNQVSNLLNDFEKKLSLKLYSTQTDLLNKLISGTNHPSNIDYLNEYFPYENYCLYLTNSNSFLGNSTIIYQTCWSLFPYNPFWILNVNSFNCFIIIVACNSYETNAIQDLLSELHNRLCNNYSPVTSIIHEKCIFLEDLTKSLVSMQRLLNNYKILGYSTLYYTRETDITTKALSDYLNEEKEKYLMNIFRENHHKVFNTYISQILESMFFQKCPKILIEECMKTIIKDLLSELNMDDSLFIYYDYIYDITNNCEDFDSLNSKILNMLDDFFQMKNAIDYEQLPQNQLAQEVRSYIEEHFTEQINIQTLASHFGIVASYLSKLYFDYYDSSIKADILELRLNKAEELLKTSPALPLRVIAELTGFNDQFYFSKVFKKERSLSPFEFRKLVNNME